METGKETGMNPTVARNREIAIASMMKERIPMNDVIGTNIERRTPTGKRILTGLKG
jgi:hypothetical protein